jgi:hypothetical protein
MDSEYQKQIDSIFSSLPYSFSFEEVYGRTTDSGDSGRKALKLIESDNNLLRLIDSESNNTRYIHKDVLRRWFSRLNIRLAHANTFRLNEKQLTSLVNDLRPIGRWHHLPYGVISFGQNKDLIWQSSPNEFIFPLAYGISLLNNMGNSIAREYLIEQPLGQMSENDYEELILEKFANVMKQLTMRQLYIISRREGIFGFSKLTLEVIGQQFELSRERIRQIEAQAWKRLWHPSRKRAFSTLFFILFLCRKCSPIIDAESSKPEVEFIMKCLSIKTWNLGNFFLIGNDEGIRLTKKTINALNDKEEIINTLCFNCPIPIKKDEAERIAEELSPTINQKDRKTERVYIALKTIGRAAHYSEIAEAYNKIFPEDYSSEHAIHAAILKENNRIVWTGNKGIFALKEWGYSRPQATLMDTVADIVQEKYKNTGQPVPFVVIEAEIGKYRKLINKNSLMIAAFLNPRIEVVANKCCRPKKETCQIVGLDSEIMDQRFTDFENIFNP